MSGTWFEPVRAYCERTDASFWGEPLNAASNVAFLIAAAVALFRERSNPHRDHAAVALAMLVAVVGLGSFLFHTLANRWSMLADVIPIAIFIHAYFFLAMRRFLGFGIATSIAVTVIFAAAGFGLVPALDMLTGQSTSALSNGSGDYLPALLALLGVGAAVLPSARATGRALFTIAGLFLLSLTFRTVDAAVCPALPMGTHMLWHILNACVLFALIETAWRYGADASRSG